MATGEAHKAFDSSKARDWREGRRLRALELIAQGYRASEVARVFGVSPGAVSQWQKRARTGGIASLLRRKPKGRESRLSPERLNELLCQLSRWATREPLTTRAVALLIHENWGIKLSRAQVSRILKSAGIVLRARNKRA